MNAGEQALLLLGLIASAAVCRRWARQIAIVPPLSRTRISPAWMLAIATLGIAIVAVAIGSGADPEVRANGGYWLLFLAPVPAIQAAADLALPLMGISPEIDVIEAGNRAALPIALAHRLGVSILYAASNVGRGDTVWTTFETAAWSIAIFCALAIATALTCEVPRSVALEHDLPSGRRFATALLALSAPLAWQSAGDWAGRPAMLRDLGAGAAVSLAIAAVAVAIERTIPWNRAPSR